MGFKDLETANRIKVAEKVVRAPRKRVKAHRTRSLVPEQHIISPENPLRVVQTR
jgi:hypothetical protein